MAGIHCSGRFHDVFTIAELMCYEALGFCERGGLMASGAISVDEDMCVNRLDALAGASIGATRSARVIEIMCHPEGGAVGSRHAATNAIWGLHHSACSVQPST
jgi:acetyl-CoA C-acetyltransferase